MNDAPARPRILSLQVGLPQHFSASQEHPEWKTGIHKCAVTGPCALTATGFIGDGQADPRHHGGPDKAVLAYVADHYRGWQQEFSLSPIPFGGFGENLAISEVDEGEVCVGDIWTIGEVRLQVSQPRQPCWKLGRRWDQKQLPKRVVQTRRTGWYFRVLAGGELAAPAVAEVEREWSGWTVCRCNEVFYDGAVEERRELAQLPVLAKAWQRELIAKTKVISVPDEQRGR